MTLEGQEILQKAESDDLVTGVLYDRPLLYKSADEYAKLQSIAFAEWVEKRWSYDDDKLSWSTFKIGDPELTTDQLYSKFLDDQSKNTDK
jgi:hypothetical protein